MSNKLHFLTNSAMFNLPQPCTCSRQEEFGFREERENEDYQFLRNEECADKVKRKNLPIDHHDYLGEGYCGLNSGKYLENILAPAWLNAFKETLKDRDKMVKVEVEYHSVHRPFEYNVETDRVGFTLTVEEEDLNRIQEKVFEYKDVFEEYLREWHSSYKDIPFSFRSHMPNSLEAWWRCLGQKDRGNYQHERAIIAMLEFWLFAYEWFPHNAPRVPSLKAFAEGLKEFREEFDRQIESLTCNGAEEECFDFLPEGSKGYDWVVDAYFLGRKPAEVFVA